MKLTQSIAFSFCLGVALVTTSGCAAQSSLSPISTSSNVQDQETQESNEKLLDPSKLNDKAPDKFKVKFETSEGDFEIEVVREWSPNGADRFYNMVNAGYFKDIYIFRGIKGFMFQFGIHGDPKVSKAWADANIQDDKANGVSNKPGYISFAQTGAPNSRSCQMFVNLGDNSFLDNPDQGSPFVPFGKVTRGMDVVNKVNTEYGENAREVQGRFKEEGNAYIKKKYPNLSVIKSVTFVEDKKE